MKIIQTKMEKINMKSIGETAGQIASTIYLTIKSKIVVIDFSQKAVTKRVGTIAEIPANKYAKMILLEINA